MPQVLFGSARLPPVDLAGIFAPKYGSRYGEAEAGGYHQHAYHASQRGVLCGLSILVVPGLLGGRGIEGDAGSQHTDTGHGQAYAYVFLADKFIRDIVPRTVTIEGGDRAILLVTADHRVWPALRAIGYCILRA